MTSHRPLEIALLLCACAPLACGDDTSPQATESSTTTSDAPSTDSTTTTSPDPDSSSTTASSSSSTTADPTEGATTTTGSSSGDSTTGDDTTGETTETTGGGSGVLENTPEPCAMEDWIFPLLPAEAGHWTATTLTPPAYPFEVERVSYELTGGAAGGQCVNSFAHLAAVFVTTEPQPVDAPSGDATYVEYAIEEDPAAMDDRFVEIELETPIVLQDGESIVVAVEMVAVDDASLCIRACRDTSVAEVDWWSNAADEPYPWADMVADFGFPSNYTIRAYGAVQ